MYWGLKNVKSYNTDCAAGGGSRGCASAAGAAARGGAARGGAAARGARGGAARAAARARGTAAARARAAAGWARGSAAPPCRRGPCRRRPARPRSDRCCRRSPSAEIKKKKQFSWLISLGVLYDTGPFTRRLISFVFAILFSMGTPIEKFG